MPHLAITINPNKRDRVYYKDDLDGVVEALINHYHWGLFNAAYELKSDGKTLHLHCTAICKRIPMFKRVQKYMKDNFPGFQLFIKKVYSDNWHKYVVKQGKTQYEQQETLITHHYRHNYMFIPDRL